MDMNLVLVLFNMKNIYPFALATYLNNSELRLGQCLFNELYKQYPDIANEIRGSEFDPFYNDNKIDAFYIKIKELYQGEE